MDLQIQRTTQSFVNQRGALNLRGNKNRLYLYHCFLVLNIIGNENEIIMKESTIIMEVNGNKNSLKSDHSNLILSVNGDQNSIMKHDSRVYATPINGDENIVQADDYSNQSYPMYFLDDCKKVDHPFSSFLRKVGDSKMIYFDHLKLLSEELSKHQYEHQKNFIWLCEPSQPKNHGNNQHTRYIPSYNQQYNGGFNHQNQGNSQYTGFRPFNNQYNGSGYMNSQYDGLGNMNSQFNWLGYMNSQFHENMYMNNQFNANGFYNQRNGFYVSQENEYYQSQSNRENSCSFESLNSPYNQPASFWRGNNEQRSYSRNNRINNSNRSNRVNRSNRINRVYYYPNNMRVPTFQEYPNQYQQQYIGEEIEPFRPTGIRKNYENAQKNSSFDKFSIFSVHKSDFQSQCSICLEKIIKNQKIMVLPCFHSFHQQCGKDWMKKEEKCPLCRVSVRDLMQRSNFAKLQ